MHPIKIVLVALLSITTLMGLPAHSAKLAIVIDDFGYRVNNENQILQLPIPISIAILPNAPHRLEMAEKAHRQGREILIHLPMAPLSKQPLEKDTLTPSMSEAEIQRIIAQAVHNVPYAVGLNNHMGSAMTSNLGGMQKVMRTLAHYQLYFLDSVTIGSTKSVQAAEGTGVRVIKRKVFLDDSQKEADIRAQFNRAISVARKQGSAIAIGHPHPTTVRVLQQMLPQLPSDIVLVKASALLNETPASRPETKPHKPEKPVCTKNCEPKVPPKPKHPNISDAIKTISKGFKTHTAVQIIDNFLATWPPKPATSEVELSAHSDDHKG